MDFKFYFSLFLRRIHWFLLFLVIGSAIGLTLARVLPAVYVARAMMLVESKQVSENLIAETSTIQANEQLQIIRQRTLTRDTLIDLANRLNIYGARDSSERPRMETDELVENMRERIEIVTTGGAARRGAPVNATFLSISFEAEDARMSATVANELVTLILREDVGIRNKTARGTLDFFIREVDRLDGELAEQGARILAFQEANQAALPDSLEFRRSQQAANQERLLQLERDTARLRDRRSRLVDLYENLGPQAQAQPAGPQTPEARQLQALKDELAGQLLVLSPTNPKIKILQARVDAMQRSVDAQAAAKPPSLDGSTPSAGLTQFDLQLAEIDGELEFLQLQRDQAERALEGLQATIEATPGNAIALETLQREYDNTREQYDAAVARRARAEESDQLVVEGGGGKLTVIEQAVIPSEPERPNRMLVAGGGVGAGFFLGLAFIALLEFFNKGIRRPVDLTNKLGITPFATLPYYRTVQEIRRRRTIIAGAFAGMVIGIPALLWGFDAYILPLDQILQRLSDRMGFASLMQPVTDALV
jgi:uncharacterized protein involved in exopolysaccharide biosynthesis